MRIQHVLAGDLSMPVNIRIPLPHEDFAVSSNALKEVVDNIFKRLGVGAIKIVIGEQEKWTDAGEHFQLFFNRARWETFPTLAAEEFLRVLSTNVCAKEKK